MSATLHALPSAKLQDIPAMLRRLADDIEAGEYGEVREAVCVTHGSGLDVFGFGSADGTVSHYLLCCAARKLEEPML
jgi:hypothetical protein